MIQIKITTKRLFVAASIIFTLAIFTTIIRTQSAASIEYDLSSISDLPSPSAFSPEPIKLSFVGVNFVHNIEELYSVVNNPLNAGNQIFMAPGIYMLSVNASDGTARPNGGRLDFQENMSLTGVHGDRQAVVIDAINLPASSFTAPPIANVGAIRLGRGTNAVEWLTIRNSRGAAGIETTIVSPGTAYIRIAHITATNNLRGVDIRSFGAAAAGRVIVAEIVDNDLHSNRMNTGQGLRLTNNTRAHGAVIFATLSDNRIYNNYFGFIAENVNTNFGSITAVSSGDQFFENGTGTQIGGGLSLGMNNTADGNTTNFTADGSSFENNNGFNPNGYGGLTLLGGANYSILNGTSDNTVNVSLRNCRFANNHVYDLGAYGARSTPETLGVPGTNNRVNLNLYDINVPNLFTADSFPEYPGGMNSVNVIRNPVNF